MKLWRLFACCILPVVSVSSKLLLPYSRNSEGNEIVIDIARIASPGSFSNCLLHAIVYQPGFKVCYQVLSPVVIQAISNLTTKVSDKPVGERAEMYRNLNCTIHILLWPGDISQAANETFFRLPRYLTRGRMPLRQFWIVATLNGDGNDDKVMQKWKSLFSLKSRTFITAAVFWLPLSLAARLKFALMAYVICYLCTSTSAFLPTSCPEDSSCVATMIRTFQHALAGGANIEWDTNIRNVNRRIHVDAYSSISHPNTSSPEVQLTISYLYEPLNKTFWPERASRTLPSVSYADLNAATQLSFLDDRHSAFLLNGRGTQLRFITSSEIEDRETSWLMIFLSPFEPSVWLYLGISLTVIVMIASILINSDNSLCHWYSTIIGFAAGLVEVTITPSGSFASGARQKSWNLLVISWVLAALVLTNSYRALMKCDYIFEPELKTRLQSLRQLRNFTLHLSPGLLPSSLTNNRIKFLRKSCAAGANPKYAFGSDCESRSLYQFCIFSSVDTSPFCYIIRQHYFGKQFEQKLRRGGGEGEHHCNNVAFQAWIKEYFGASDNVLRRWRRLNGSLANATRTYLNDPQTIYLTSSELLERDWDVVRKIAKENGLRFAHNGRSDDGFLKTTDAYEITRVLDGFGVNLVLARSKSLATSGLFSLWKSWETRRKIRAVALEVKGFMALSLENSDVSLVFSLYSYGIGFSAVAFIAEFSRNAFTRCRCSVVYVAVMQWAFGKFISLKNLI